MTDQITVPTVADGGADGDGGTAGLSLKRSKRTLFVDRASQCWVVRDLGGEFWLVPSGEDPWKHRQLIDLSEDMQLEPVPSHYLSMLRIPR